MILTHSMIHSAGTSGIGFNFHQLRVLGVTWPPRRGWISELVGKEVTEEQWKLVMSMKGCRRIERKQILNGSGYEKQVFSPPVRTRDLRKKLYELEDLIRYVREKVTVEVAAYGTCDCNVPEGECPCAYCASVHFNERTKNYSKTPHHR